MRISPGDCLQTEESRLIDDYKHRPFLSPCVGEDDRSNDADGATCRATVGHPKMDATHKTRLTFLFATHITLATDLY